jgi:hypothetical protein
VIVSGPIAQDLYGVDRTHYLDLPGNPLTPNARRPLQRGADGELRADHVRPCRQQLLNRLTVQYWSFYASNYFNNKHESDWEMMQSVWDIRGIAAAFVLALLPIVPLTLVVICLPFAVWLLLRWAFLPQGVMLDGKRWPRAPARLARAGRGCMRRRWARCSWSSARRRDH